MAESCWICKKEKGQPPERCNGHYDSVLEAERARWPAVEAPAEKIDHHPIYFLIGFLLGCAVGFVMTLLVS